MVQGARKRLQYRRRRSGETDYHRRSKLLRARKPRAVVRISNTQTSCQLVNYLAAGDEVVVNFTGQGLVSKYGWPESNSRKSLPASYLVGLAMGKAAVAAGYKEAILDIGLAASRGSRVYAALKGMLDAGLDLPHGESAIPDDERLNGAHINEKLASQVEKTRGKIEGAF
ncbi:MAG: 50S ribosomal protein L18 [Candidatus Poseidoniales archaeon]